MANELDKKGKTKSLQIDLINQDIQNDLIQEIKDLMNEPEFVDFVQSISDSIDDNVTFNELLSSKEILSKAIKILQKIKPK
jgi:hypothetical protein